MNDLDLCPVDTWIQIHDHKLKVTAAQMRDEGTEYCEEVHIDSFEMSHSLRMNTD